VCQILCFLPVGNDVFPEPPHCKTDKNANISEFPSLYLKARVVTFCFVTFRVKEVGTFCVEKLLQFVLKKLLHFGAKVFTVRVNVTFCVESCYILR